MISTPPSLIDRISARIPEATLLYHRLILLVGPPRSGKTSALQHLSSNCNWPLINVNLRLSELLLELTQKQRAIRVPRLLGEIVAPAGSDVVLLDNIELLFSPELAQDPMRLLQGFSRHRTIVAGWCGTFDGAYLTYAEPGHPEARRYSHPEAIIVPVNEPSRDVQASASGSSESPQETA